MNSPPGQYTKIFIVLLVLTIIIRILAFLICQPWDPDVENNIIVSTTDALGYQTYALNFLENWSFEAVGDFSLHRTPGYPIYLAMVYSITGNAPWVAILLQVILSSFVALFIWKIGCRWFGQKASIVAVGLYAIEPHAIIASIELLPDLLFSLFSLWAIYYFLKAIEPESPNLWFATLCGLLLGIAVHLKPVGQFLVVVLIIIAIFKYKLQIKNIILPSTALVLGIILVIGPWMTRNYIVYDHFKLTNKGGSHLLNWVATYVKAGKDGEDPLVIRKQFNDIASNQGYDELTNPFERSNLQGSIAKAYIFDNFGTYVQHSIKGVIYTFTNLGTQRISQLFGLESTELSFHYYAAPGFIESIKAFWKSKTIGEISIGLYVLTILMLIYLLFALGVTRAFNERKYWILTICGLVISYYLALIGPIGIARYKIPFMPLFLLFSAYGGLYLWERYRSHRK